MAYGKIKMGSVYSAQGEPKSQSKVNPALSYGQRTGKIYVNKEKVNKTMPKIGKKSNDSERKLRKEYEKAYANYKGAAKPMKVDAKKQKTIADLIKKKPVQPKVRGGR